MGPMSRSTLPIGGLEEGQPQLTHQPAEGLSEAEFIPSAFAQACLHLQSLKLWPISAQVLLSRVLFLPWASPTRLGTSVPGHTSAAQCEQI